MPLCPVWVKKIANVTEAFWTKDARGNSVKTGTNKVKKEKTMICGRKPEFFVRAFYKELHQYRKGEGKYEDLFCLCADHGPVLAADVAAWNSAGQSRWSGDRAVSGLRGLVERVEVVPPGEVAFASMAREDRDLRVMASVKSDFKRKMRQSNTSKLSVDQWRRVFEECVEEWLVEGVMES